MSEHPIYIVKYEVKEFEMVRLLSTSAHCSGKVLLRVIKLSAQNPVMVSRHCLPWWEAVSGTMHSEDSMKELLAMPMKKNITQMS